MGFERVQYNWWQDLLAITVIIIVNLDEGGILNACLGYKKICVFSESKFTKITILQWYTMVFML